MKILILTNNARGLYTFRKELLFSLKNLGNEVCVSVPREEGFDKLEFLVGRIIPTHLNRRGMNPFEDMNLVVSYLKIINKYRPDCVLTYTIKPNIYGGIVSKFCGIPYLPNITGLGTSFDKDNILRKILVLLYRLSINSAACVFFQNKDNKKKLLEYGVVNDNSIILPGSGVNLEDNTYEPYPSDNTIINFLFVARVMTNKGINELIEVSRLLKKKYNNLVFHVVGMCEDGYEDKVKKWHDEKLIVYHGPQENMHVFYKMCSCLIHPSYHEGMSNVCLEAAATGRPILASKVPGCQEIFCDGVTGIGFEPRNVQSLVNAIEKFLKLSTAERAKMGKLGREKVEKEFDRKIVIDAYLKKIKMLTKNM